MKILVVGQYATYREGRYESANCVIGHEVETARALARRGHEVTMTGATDPAAEPPRSFRVIGARDVRVDDYGAVLLIPEFGHRWVVNATDQIERLRRHPNVLIWADCMPPEDGAGVIDDFSYAKVIACSSTRVAADYAKLWPHIRRLYLPWAAPIVGDKPSPYPRESWRPRAVYCGFMTAREIAILNALADGSPPWELWVGGIWTDAPGGPDNFTTEERHRLFAPSVRFMTDQLSYPDHVYRTPSRRHGQVMYDDTFAFFQHACAGLCFARSPTRQTVMTSKLLDYAAAGLPAVIEQPVVNAGDAMNLGGAIVVPFDDVDAIWTAVARLTSVDHREPLKAEAREWGTYDDRARVIESHLLD